MSERKVRSFSPDDLRSFGTEFVRKTLPRDVQLLTLVSEGEGGCWADLAEYLRGHYTPKRQAKILEQFFGPEGINFHNGEELARFLTLINNIKLFSPTSRPSSGYITRYVNQHLAAADESDRPKVKIKVISDDWEEAENAARCVVAADGGSWFMHSPLFGHKKLFDTALNTGRINEFCTAENVACSAVSKAAYESANENNTWSVRNVVTGISSVTAAYITVQDLMRGKGGSPQSNPSMPLVHLLKRGIVPIGIVDEEYVVFVPPIKEK
jgi:hypothetical protein